MAAGAMLAVVGSVEAKPTRQDRRLIPSRLKALERRFLEMDVDGNGQVSIVELQALWRFMFPELSKETIQKDTVNIFKSIDFNNDMLLTWDELVEYIERRCAAIESNAETEEELLVTMLFTPGTDPQEELPSTLKEWVWAVVEQTAAQKYKSSWLRDVSLAVQLLMQLTIFLSIIVMMTETMPDMYNEDSGTSGNTATFCIEAVCIALFTAEVALRFVSSPDRRQLLLSLWTAIDVGSVLPFYLTLSGALPSDSGAKSLVVLRVLRMLRLGRVLRVLKLGRGMKGIQVMSVAAFRARIAIVMMCVLMLMTVVFYACLMYFVEREDATFDEELGRWIRPENSTLKDAGPGGIFFQSIPDAMWWALVTVSTVGYGDMYPVTGLGKLVAALTMVTGVLVLSYPITVLTNSFANVMEEFKEEELRDDRRREFDMRLLSAEKMPSIDTLMNAQRDARRGTRGLLRSMPHARRRRTKGSVSSQPSATARPSLGATDSDDRRTCDERRGLATDCATAPISPLAANGIQLQSPPDDTLLPPLLSSDSQQQSLPPCSPAEAAIRQLRTATQRQNALLDHCRGLRALYNQDTAHLSERVCGIQRKLVR
eukprot:TRINITY_DN47973_c0_g1_i1.p1 TRINITY_DN47973_c0_g1~~TRINITY_DN47973_c0_g1_i1.p1  ORF type:complete len:620 (+),score=170.47 TRINITY_DN47973_c0_g1_i1:69-1862(+)